MIPRTPSPARSWLSVVVDGTLNYPLVIGFPNKSRGQ